MLKIVHFDLSLSRFSWFDFAGEEQKQIKNKERKVRGVTLAFSMTK